MKNYSNMVYPTISPEQVAQLKALKEKADKEKNDKIIDLKRKNTNIWYIQSGVAFAGSVAGLMYAFKTDKSFWGKLGYWILGGIIVGVPSGVIAHLMNSKRNAEIAKLEGEESSNFEAYKYKALYGDPSDVKSFDTSDMSVVPNDLD